MKATIYTTSEMFGELVKYEGTITKIEIKPYAQYTEALHVVFIPKGKRKPVRIIKAYNPLIVIISGWNNPACENINKIVKQEQFCTITQTKYSSFDERYTSEANHFLDSFLTGCDVLVDYRKSINTKIINYINK